MTRSNKILILTIVLAASVFSVFLYDTDDSYRVVMKKYGYDIGERVRTPLCKDDGVGVWPAPFGTVSSYCGTSWFVLFNIFPFQIKGEKQSVVLDTRHLLSDIEPLRGWYSHHISGNILLTRQEELPDIGATEIYAYGEQIGIYLIKNGLTPEEWAAQKAYIDLDDVLVSSKEWSTYHGQKLLTVEHEAAGAGGKMLTKYLFAGDLIYIVSLYPLETYDDESGVYVRNDEGVRDLSRVMYRLLPQILSQESVRQELAENCARDISQRVDDASFDQENKIVMTWLWDEESQDNIAIILPYEPETDFADCSESVKELLRHIQGISGENDTGQKDKDIMIKPQGTVAVNFCGKDMEADSVALNGVDVIKIIARIESEDKGLWLCNDSNSDNISPNFFDETLGVAAKGWRWDDKGHYVSETEKSETNVYVVVLYSKKNNRQSNDPFNQSIFIYKFDFNNNKVYTQSQFDGSFHEAGVINNKI